MYNKEISEKIVSDCFDMMNNIRESWRACKEIADRAKREIESIHAKIYGEAFCNLMELWRGLESKKENAEKTVEEILDINGGMKGYDTRTYLLLLNHYTYLVMLNKEVNNARNKIRERYM